MTTGRIDRDRVHQRQQLALYNILCAALRDAEPALQDLTRAVQFVKNVRDELAPKGDTATDRGETLDVKV